MPENPPVKAVANGHILEWDPTHAFSAAVRWTCRDCGASALRYCGNEYGGATERPCPEAGERDGH